METVVRTVGDLDKTDRSALERVVGHALGESQRLVIQVMTPRTAGPATTAVRHIAGPARVGRRVQGTERRRNRRPGRRHSRASKPVASDERRCMNPALLDTDTLSEVLKRRDPVVVQNARTYLAQYRLFAFSAVTRYEVRRGYLSRKAARAFSDSKCFARTRLIYPVTDDVLDQAAHPLGRSPQPRAT